MITKRTSLKGRSICVTFKLPADRATMSASVVGSFNGWDPARHPMKLDKSRGQWTRNISFKPGQRIEFRYLVDGGEWCNDEEVDAYATTPFFSQNGILEL